MSRHKEKSFPTLNPENFTPLAEAPRCRPYEERQDLPKVFENTQLYNKNCALIKKTAAYNYTNRHLPGYEQADLEQEAAVALLEAHNRYDENSGTPENVFLKEEINFKLMDFKRHNCSQLHLGGRVAKALYPQISAINTAVSTAIDKGTLEQTLKTLSSRYSNDKISISPAEIWQYYQAMNHCHELNAPEMDDNGFSNANELPAVVEDICENTAHSELTIAVREQLENYSRDLPPIDQKILTNELAPCPLTQQQLALDEGFPVETIRSRRKNLIKKLRHGKISRQLKLLYDEMD